MEKFLTTKLGLLKSRKSTFTSVAGVVFDNVKYGQKRVTQNADLPLHINDGSQPAQYVAPHGPVAAFRVDPPSAAPRKPLTFTAQPVRGARYTWLFGDGTTAHGRRVRHSFPDAEGTSYDGANGAGRFRVLLHVVDRRGAEDWASQGVVVVAKWHDDGNKTLPLTPGLAWTVYPGTWSFLPDFTRQRAVFSGEAPGLAANARGFTRYGVVWQGFIDIPADGGYTFHLMDRDGARVAIDGMEVARTGPPFAQVCGAFGNALRYARGSLGLRAGLHQLRVEGLNTTSGGAPRLLWEGPSLPLTDVPVAAFSHARQDVVKAVPAKSAGK